MEQVPPCELRNMVFRRPGSKFGRPSDLPNGIFAALLATSLQVL